jgi:hypothetical protein
MVKYFSKKIILLVFTTFLLSNIFFVVSVLAAAEWTPPDIQIKFPDKLFQTQVACSDNKDGTKTCQVPWIAEYISAIYKYAVGIVGIIAVIVMMLGGVLWMTAGGSAPRVSEARAWITAALTGLVLILASYTILYTVNPDLVNLKYINIKTVKLAAPTLSQGTCQWSNYDKDNPNAKSCSNLSGLGQNWTKSDDKKLCPTNDEYNKSDYWDCCCPTLDTSFCPSGIQCQACDNCVASQVPCNYPTKCFLNADLESKLETAHNIDSQIFITEPWPPTVAHKDPCHQNGTCADVDVRPNSEDATVICSAYKALTQAGFTSLTYEQPSCLNNETSNIYTKQCGMPCKYYPTSRGSSFHVNN